MDGTCGNIFKADSSLNLKKVDDEISLALK
jgi:hypothetical protein